MARGQGAVIVLGLAALPEGVDWTPTWMKEIAIVGSLTYGAETFRGKRQDTFVRAVELLRRRRADLRAIRPRKYRLEQFQQALTEAASKENLGGDQGLVCSLTGPKKRAALIPWLPSTGRSFRCQNNRTIC